VQRLRHQLLGYFPAALDAFDDLDAADALELLGKAPDPARAARLTRSRGLPADRLKITAVLSGCWLRFRSTIRRADHGIMR
jgi:hypothetical protein